VYVVFPKPLDYALLMRLVEVSGVAGAAAVERNETQWRFTPSQPWRAGDYTLKIDNALEDLAGNRIGRPFDVDTFERVSEHLTSQTTSLPFRVHGN